MDSLQILVKAKIRVSGIYLNVVEEYALSDISLIWGENYGTVVT